MVPCDDTFATVKRCDLAVATAIDADETNGLHRNRAASKWLRRAYDQGTDVVSVCTGAFLLAEAGLLESRKVTTHWAFQEILARRFPSVRIQPQAIIVDEGRVCTCAGAMSFINVALYLVERFLGPDVAYAASKMFLIDVSKAPQTAYAVFSSQKGHGDERILAAQVEMESHPRRVTSLSQLARKVAMSERTFVRRFKQATGNTPRDYLLRVRVEAAKRALEQSNQSVSVVASGVGYRDTVAFRRIFSRFTGLTPSEYRSRYSRSSLPMVRRSQKTTGRN